MKTTITDFLKTIFIIGVLIYANSTNAQIHSTFSQSPPMDWADPDTWIGGIVPGPTDDVVINGAVVLVTGKECNNLTISPSTGGLPGFLQAIGDSIQGFLTVNGNITNYGAIIEVSIKVHGNIANHHVWGSRYIIFVGSTDQYVTSSHISPVISYFNQYLISRKPSGHVHFSSSLHFQNTVIDFNGDSLYMDVGTDTIRMVGGNIKDVTIISNASPGQIYISLDNNLLYDAYVNNINIEANEVVLDSLFLYDDFFNIFGDARVEGVLQNRSSNQTVTIHGNLTNNGTIQGFGSNCYLYTNGLTNNGLIQDNGSNCNLYITGDINQNGSWTNKYTYLSGDADQNLWFTQPFNGQYLTNSNNNGKVISNSTLSFNSTIIDFNYDTLMFATGADSLIVNGDYFLKTVIEKEESKTPGFLNCTLSGDAYFQDMVMTGKINLGGLFEYKAPMSFYGHLTVTDTLRNRSNTSYIATINGDITNNGVIEDNYWSCYLYITGNVIQNGTWTNNHTYLSGNMDQNLFFTKTFEGENLTNSNNNGKVISNSTLVFNSTIVDFNYDTLMFAAGADSLIVNGDYFQEAVILKESGKTSGFLNCTLGDNAYFHDMDIIGENINLDGAFQYDDPMNFYGHVTVGDTLRNRSNTNQTATINGNLTNNGVIENNYWNCFLNITGDINQNGIWTNNYTYLSGNNDQNLNFTRTFEGDYLINSNNNGKVISNSTLAFINTKIDFNYDTLMFAAEADSLIVNGDYFQKAVITKEGSKTAGFLNCTLGDNAYFSDMEIIADNLNMGGVFQYDDPMSFYGHITVEDTLRNRGNTNQTATINGNLTNNGVIEDNYWNCFLNITGDINQNGTWTNKYTYLSGGAGQNLAFTMPFAGEYFTSTKPAGIATASTPLWFNNTIIDFNGDSLYMTTGNDSIYIDGGYLQEMTILAGNAPMQLYCHQTGNAWFDDVNIEADEVVLDGVFQYSTYFNVYGNVIVKDTLQNRSNTTSIATIYGNLTNNGTIQDNYWSCYLNITGDINQNGIWENQRTTLNGDTDQIIYLVNQNEITGQVYFDALSAGAPYQWFYEGGILNSADFTGETLNALIWQVPVSGNWYGDFYCETGAGPSRTITVEGGLIVDVALMLEGPFNGSGMNTSLNSNGHIPLAQPYNISPWNYTGTESVGSVPSDIVDWVLVGFRETSGGPETATDATTVKQRALFLNNDGYLVNLDGTRGIKINVPSVTENLYIIVWHRNHLGIMSANPLSLDVAPIVYDFTSGESQAYGGASGHKNLGNGIYGMMGGDADYNQVVDWQDKLVWAPNTGITAAYEPHDFNMDNEINNQDKNDVWSGNTGSSTQVPE